MKIKCFSLNPAKYPDRELEFKEISIDEIYDYVDSTVIMARKTALVSAEMLKEAKQVDTRPRTRLEDGNLFTFQETTNTAPAGAIVITNPDGEQYVLKDKVKDGKLVASASEQFHKKYAKAKGGYVPQEGPKRFVVATENIAFPASWGEMQYAPKGSYICIEYGKGEEYSVTNSAFEATYEIQLPDDVSVK